MSRTFNTTPKAKQQKRHRCTCEGCQKARRHNYRKKLSLKDGINSEGVQWALDQLHKFIPKSP